MNILKNYCTDKFDLGYIDHIYSKIFNDNILQKTKNLMEIGIYNGGSILLWHDIFINAKIHAVDINFCSHIPTDNNRIQQYTENAYTKKFVDRLQDQSLDIIIDDGPHTLDSFFFLIDHYLSKLATNGLMIIEDIIDVKWTPILINRLISQQNIKIKNLVFDMKHKQKTQDLYNKWQNGLDVLVIERL